MWDSMVVERGAVVVRRILEGEEGVSFRRR